jgi:hypothetical protein
MNQSLSHNYLLFHSGVHNGVGTLNANKDGTPKSIMVGNVERNRTAGQKIRHENREGLKETYTTSKQTRELMPILVELAIQPNNNNAVELKEAETFCESLLAGFLKRNLKRAEDKKKKSKKADPDKEEKDKFEVVKYSAKELEFLKDCATRRGKGETIDLKKIEYPYTTGDFEIDLFLFGRMRPTNIVGSFKVASGIGINPIVSEKDFFTAADDLLNKNSASGDNSHCGDHYLSSYVAYHYAVLNVAEALKYFKGDVQRTNDLLACCVDLVMNHAPKSNSIGSPNQGLTFYLMVEKTDSPRSLELAFQQPMNTTEDLVVSLRDVKKAIDGMNPAIIVPSSEVCGLPGLACGTKTDIINFIKI